MEIEIIKSKGTEGRLKLTLHKSGNLGFSFNAINILNIKEKKFASIGKEKNDNEINNLYMKIKEQSEDGDYSIKKTGGYYIIKTKSLFDEIKLDYTDEKKTIIFDIEEINYEGEKWLKLKKREKIKSIRNKK